MFGPYLVTCETCDFEDEIAGGEDAQAAAERHSEREGHATRITEVNTDAAITVEK